MMPEGPPGPNAPTAHRVSPGCIRPGCHGTQKDRDAVAGLSGPMPGSMPFRPYRMLVRRTYRSGTLPEGPAWVVRSKVYDEMAHRNGPALGILALAATVAACSSGSSPPASPSSTAAASLAVGDIGSDRVTVAPDRDSSEFLVQVTLTDDGFEPQIIQMPAGRRVRLVLRNGGTTEHHYRVQGLVAAEVGWLLEPELDVTDLDAMTDEELAQAGLANENTQDADEMEHILHHLTPTFVPFRDVSPAGIKPLRNEVHGYVTLGDKDVLTFFPLTTGRYEVKDVLHPEITGTVVVFMP